MSYQGRYTEAVWEQVADAFVLDEAASAAIAETIDLTASKSELEMALTILNKQREVGLKGELAVAIALEDAEQIGQLQIKAQDQAINGLKRRIIRREVTARNGETRRKRYHI